MYYSVNNFQKAIISLLLLLPLNSFAVERVRNNSLMEFSLMLSNHETFFAFSSGHYKTLLKQWGINWYERFTPYFHVGLELGNMEMTQPGHTPLSSQYTSGEYAGVNLRLLPIDNSDFTLLFKINYRYNQTKGETTNQLTEFSWDETRLTGQAYFKPATYIHLFAAAEYRTLTGEQHDSGDITQIISFKESKQKGYRFGINIISNHTGTIGLERISGYNRGTQLYFSRKF